MYTYWPCVEVAGEGELAAVRLVLPRETSLPDGIEQLFNFSTVGDTTIGVLRGGYAWRLPVPADVAWATGRYILVISETTAPENLDDIVDYYAALTSIGINTNSEPPYLVLLSAGGTPLRDMSPVLRQAEAVVLVERLRIELERRAQADS